MHNATLVEAENGLEIFAGHRKDGVKHIDGQRVTANV